MRTIMKLAVLTVAVLAAKHTYSAINRSRAGSKDSNNTNGSYPDTSDMNARSASGFAQSDAV